MKFIGAISSLVCGIMAFVGLSLTCFSNGLLGGAVNYTGWELIKDDFSGSGFVLFRLFAIIGLVFGAILILYGFLLLLIDLKVIKVKAKNNLYLINNIFISIFVLCMILTFVGAWVMKGDALIPDRSHIGVGTWLMLVIPVVLCALSWLCSKNTSKK